MSEFISNGESQQSPEEKRRQKLKQSLDELSRRTEAGELDPGNFGPRDIARLQLEGRPITKSEVANKPVIIMQQELDALGYIDIVLPSGEVMTIESEVTGYRPEDNLIIFPEELGELQKEEIEETDKPEIQEIMKYIVELSQKATFSNLVEGVRHDYGDEAAKEVKSEIEYQTQQQEGFDWDSSIISFYEEKGLTQQDIRAWLPIIFY